MKLSMLDKRGLSVYVLLLGIIGTISAGFLPSALAQANNSPLITFSPSTPDVGGSVLVTITGDPTVGLTATAPHTDVRVGWANPGFIIADLGTGGIGPNPDTDGDGDPDNCALLRTIPFPPVLDEEDLYYLMTVAGGTTAVEFSIPAGGTVTLSIPGGISGATSIVLAGGATTTDGDLTGFWVPQNTVFPDPPALDELSPPAYRFLDCGYDQGAGASGAGRYSRGTDFSTQTPVAGEILSIDTTALLIAGISTNPMWTMLSLALVAGSAFALLRFQVYRK